MSEKKPIENRVPGMVRGPRFAEVEHAQNVGATMKRLAMYFAKEKRMVGCMLLVVVLGTLCGVVAPSLQSRAIDIIAGAAAGSLVRAVLAMLLA